MAPTVSLPFDDTKSPTAEPSIRETLPDPDPWYTNMFKAREHDADTTETVAEDATLMIDDDDDTILEPDVPPEARKLEAGNLDSYYEKTESEERMKGILDKMPVLSSPKPIQEDEGNISTGDIAVHTLEELEQTYVHNVLNEEHKIKEAILYEQKRQKAANAGVVSQLQQEEKRYETELRRLELMEAMQARHMHW